MASFSLVASAWKSTRRKRASVFFRIRSAAAKGLSGPKGMLQRPIRLITHIVPNRVSTSQEPKPGTWGA